MMNRPASNPAPTAGASKAVYTQERHRSHEGMNSEGKSSQSEVPSERTRSRQHERMSESMKLLTEKKKSAML